MGTEIDVLDDGALAQPGLAQAAKGALVLAAGRLAINEQPEPVLAAEVAGIGRVLQCVTTIRMAARVASAENVPESSSVASPRLLPLPHRAPARTEPVFLFDRDHLLVGGGPCGVVGDAPASSKRSGKSTGLWRKPGLSSQARFDRHCHGCRSSPPCRGAMRVRGTLAFHCKSSRNVSQAAAAQARIIRLRHGAPRRLSPEMLAPCPHRSTRSLSRLRRPQSQAPPSGFRRPVAAQLPAATP